MHKHFSNRACEMDRERSRGQPGSGSSFDSLAGVGADGKGAEKGVHAGRRLTTDNAAAGRTEVKRWA